MIILKVTKSEGCTLSPENKISEPTPLPGLFKLKYEWAIDVWQVFEYASEKLT